MRMSSQVRLIVLLLSVANYSFSQFSLKPALQTSETDRPANLGSTVLNPPPPLPQKSVVLAVVYSLILPGLGDVYAENSRIGKYFLGTEGGLWLTYGSFRVYGRWLKQDAQTLATQRAGANFDGKDAQFTVNLGNFNTVYDYNDAKLRNRQYDLVYDPNSNYNWSWTSDQDRARFKSLRIRGDEVLKNSQFVLGFMFINRLISAVSAVRSVYAYNRQVVVLQSWRLSTEISGGLLATQGLELTLSKDF